MGEISDNLGFRYSVQKESNPNPRINFGFWIFLRRNNSKAKVEKSILASEFQG